MLQIAFQLQLSASESRKLASNLQMPVSKCSKCHAVCKVIVIYIYNKLQTPYVALTFPQYAAHTVQLIVFDFEMPQAFYSLQIFWASERGKRTSWFPDMIPNIANSMQFADVSCTAAKLRDGNAQAVAAKCCKYRAILHTDAFTQRDADTQGCFYTRVLLPRDAFHKDLFFHRDVYTYRCFYPEMLLETNTFMRRCFYTGMLLHRGAVAHRHAGTSTDRCLYTAVLLHRNAFIRTCDFIHWFF